MNRIGLTGPHKCGKTTLAKAYAKKWGMKYLDMQISNVLKAFGMPVNEDVPFARRLEAQNNLLRSFINTLSDAGENYIADRTFIDLAAYTLSYMPHTISDIESESMKAYVDQCFQAQKAFFDHTIVLGNAFVPADPNGEFGKGRYTWAWNFQLETLMKGLVLSPFMKSPVNFISNGYNTVDKRMDRLADFTAASRHDGELQLH